MKSMGEDRSASPILLTLLATVALLSTVYGRDTAKPSPLTHVQNVVRNNHPAAASPHRPRATRGAWTVLVQTFNRFSDDRIMTEAAGVTFYVLLALFPAIATLISIYGLFANPVTVSEQLQMIAAVVPAGGLQIIEDQVKALAANGQQALSFGVVIGVLTSLWSANQGIKGVFDALNVVYHEKEKRGYITRTALSLCFTFGAILFLVLAMLAIVVIPIVLAFVGFQNDVATLLALSRWPLLIVTLMLFLAAVYRFGPSRTHARWRWITWGSTFSVIMWLVASIGFSYYVANFGSYNKTYGSLGAVIGFITWIWISAMIALLGAELNAELEQEAP
jgi:membrane protein